MSSQRKECLLYQVIYEVREKENLLAFALCKTLMTCQSNLSGDESRGEADQEIFKKGYCSFLRL